MKSTQLIIALLTLSMCLLAAAAQQTQSTQSKHVSRASIKFDKLVELWLKSPKDISLSLYEKFREKFHDLFNAVNKTFDKSRFELFKQRAKKILQSKIDFALGKSSVELGFTPFADWTKDELKKLTINPSNMHIISYEDSYISKNSEEFLTNIMRKYNKTFAFKHDEWQTTKGLPLNVDLRKTNCIATPRFQGECGSCWAFSGSSVMETFYCLDEQKKSGNYSIAPEYLSVQHPLDCMYKDKDGCSGGSSFVLVMFYMESNFVVKDQCYKYVARSRRCRIKESDFKTNSECFKQVPGATQPGNDVKVHFVGEGPEMMHFLSKHGSLATDIGFNDQERLAAYKRGVYSFDDEPKLFDPKKAKYGHGIVIVGYGEERGKKYWLIKNSWSTDWGEAGYGKLEQGRDGRSFIQGNTYGYARE